MDNTLEFYELTIACPLCDTIQNILYTNMHDSSDTQVASIVGGEYICIECGYIMTDEDFADKD